MLVISILYNGEIEGFECVFPCFLPDYDAVSMPRKLQKWIVLFSCFTQFWACNEADEPHFSALYTPKLHLCTLVLMPGTPFPHTPKPLLGYPISPFGVSHFAIWDVPFCHLGCPISPFGVSHFAFWGIPFRHLGYIFGTFAHNVQPRFSVCLLRFRCKSLYVFFPFGSSCFFEIHLAG